MNILKEEYMYKDYEGSIIVDTVDHIRTTDDYAKSKSIDLKLFKVLRIEIGGVRDNLTTKFICENRLDGNIENFHTKTDESIFKEFFKKSKIVIENN